MNSKRFQILEQEATVLKLVAAQYPPDSKEHQAIRHAGFALSFALTRSHEKFADFIRECSEELTDEQADHLRKLGLE